MKGWYFIIDVEKCENCKNCFLACKDEHVGNDWPGYSAPMPNHGPSGIEVTGNERGQFPLIDVGYLPRPCMHCDDAPCMKAAGGAIRKRLDGIVIIDPVKAKGRQDLIGSCPYGAIFWNEESALPQKCTFCAHLLDEGWKQTRCMQSCPTGALSVRCIEEKEMEKTIRSEGLEVFKPEYDTKPRVYYKNLYRYMKCFIAGSVAVKIDGREECAEGATVTFFKDSRQIGQCITDNFGDFKLDNLDENSGVYTVTISLSGYSQRSIEIEVTKSVSMGNIYLT